MTEEKGITVFKTIDDEDNMYIKGRPTALGAGPGWAMLAEGIALSRNDGRLDVFIPMHRLVMIDYCADGYCDGLEGCEFVLD